MVKTMKKFTQIRELAGRKPEGQQVAKKKVGKIQYTVNKERNGFVTYIDGDRLDTYKSQREAEKSAMEFIKQYKET